MALPGEDSVFGDVYGGSDAYVKFDILSTAEPQYHYPNLETTSKGWVEDRHTNIREDNIANYTLRKFETELF